MAYFALRNVDPTIQWNFQRRYPFESFHFTYSRLTLVVTFWEASHISLKKTFSPFLSLYIVLYTPRGFPICEKKFRSVYNVYGTVGSL